MKRFGALQIVFFVTCAVAFAPTLSARTSDNPDDIHNWRGEVAQASPAYCLATHDIGNIALGVSNNGTLGPQYSSSGQQDCFTGELVPNCSFPKGSDTWYLFGAAFWIGAVVNRDTLVSVGQDGWQANVAEFHPDEAPIGNMIYRSNIDPAKPEYVGAVSEQDYVAVYTDTFTSGVPGLTNDVIENRPHIPLHIQVKQESYAWSYSYAEDFVLFDYQITNIGRDRLRKVYMGVYVDADVHHNLFQANGAQDDICGFRKSVPAFYLPAACADEDEINIAWISDNDGDFEGPPGTQVPNVTGARIVRTPSDSLVISFNWWVGNTNPEVDFGPQTKAKFRNLSTGGQGTPEGDRNKYWFLSNNEFDYDQIYTASISALDPIWSPPNPRLKWDLSNGFDTRYLLSFGPFDIEPGQTLPLSFAYVGGENFHTDADNINWLQEGNYDPQEFYSNLSFDDLGENAIWAGWIYDNPGVDTDSDGYFGEAYACTVSEDNIEEIYRTGDGVPDFKGASPPPAPETRVDPRVGAITVRWNGVRSETTVDAFSQERDFEGYRVYLARDERATSFTLLASYDYENFNKWVWINDSARTGFFLLESPFTVEELRCLYAPDSCGDTMWHPLDFPRTHPLRFTKGGEDSVVYFEAQDFNQSKLGVDTPIKKRFREDEMIKPLQEWIDDTTKNKESIPPELRDSVLTKEGRFKWYEYEFTIDTLLPTVPYWINVSAFDYGSPQSGLPSLETSPTVLPVITYALESTDSILVNDELRVFVYPNPYRLDANYRAAGFEGRGFNQRDRPDDRVRRIHFANLPPKCKISIYSIDGDLVREINHDMDPSDPLSNHDTWDLITRNTQIVVSGLYYWTVETPDGRTQIGKVAIIL